MCSFMICVSYEGRLKMSKNTMLLFHQKEIKKWITQYLMYYQLDLTSLILKCLEPHCNFVVLNWQFTSNFCREALFWDPRIGSLRANLGNICILLIRSLKLIKVSHFLYGRQSQQVSKLSLAEKFQT